MELTSRFTLYDLLSMFFPGCFIIWGVMSFNIIHQLVHRPVYMTDFYCYIAFFVAAYVIGIGWNEMMRYIWRLFENTFKESCIKRIVEGRSERFLNAYNTLHGDTNVKKYKNAYTTVCENESKGTISVVEGQVSMLRNLALPFAFWIATMIYDKTEDICCCTLIGCVAFLAMLIIAIFRQRRKYDIILTKYSYMKNDNAQTDFICPCMCAKNK